MTTYRLGVELGLSKEELIILKRGSLLHDIGKIGVRDSILHKPGLLTNDEWKSMRHHPEIGAKIVDGIPFLEETIPIIRYHHERWNGSGYPLGLQGDEIPIAARIFAVADVFDALTSRRPYRRTATDAEAFEYLQENAKILFDPKIVKVFEKLLNQGAISAE
ncbi:MAG: HD-GYP domain-containing protein [Anaerolineae bacterium]|nr:HD-GYP domain-containing protein [Anaerolineae bacterium]MBT7073232.1 HD-GYP domain-containing protein [Anaerolineae bacterium]MBT7325352.1 HD-GYP domain-containing protein [Anaerolineae bacterium]